ncbi:uncharacterized [Tachysurus ichikawai]
MVRMLLLLSRKPSLRFLFRSMLKRLDLKQEISTSDQLATHLHLPNSYGMPAGVSCGRDKSGRDMRAAESRELWS